ncbi:class I SAM-dependent methyltransferase [Nioella nitratireducens]|uniref:class I SAM-dependent methyltransferase n=1 Tax=Nioella nitratireducens TaxID=1287720 RepID=UPI0008FD540F|nr:class I SAM-dependent methyltransferase [Nioella nitratireducens]
MGFFADFIPRTGDKGLTKWAHYFEVYERELTRFRREPVTFLEIGVFRGGSLPMWKEFFADGSTLVFVDIDPECKAHEIPGTHVEIGNQADPAFLASLVEKYGPFDVILDDGSHVCAHQIASFNGLWPHLDKRGVYLVEDCHTSYWPGFGGGYRNEASFIEFAKRLVDKMHSWYTDQDGLFPFDQMARVLCGVRFYDSIVVCEKSADPEPPVSLFIRNGEVSGSRKALEIRNRSSVFSGKDGR